MKNKLILDKILEESLLIECVKDAWHAFSKIITQVKVY